MQLIKIKILMILKTKLTIQMKKKIKDMLLIQILKKKKKILFKN